MNRLCGGNVLDFYSDDIWFDYPGLLCTLRFLADFLSFINHCRDSAFQIGHAHFKTLTYSLFIIIFHISLTLYNIKLNQRCLTTHKWIIIDTVSTSSTLNSFCSWYSLVRPPEPINIQFQLHTLLLQMSSWAAVELYFNITKKPYRQTIIRKALFITVK